MIIFNSQRVTLDEKVDALNVKTPEASIKKNKRKLKSSRAAMQASFDNYKELLNSED